MCKVPYGHTDRGLAFLSGFHLHLSCSASLHSHWTWLLSIPLSLSPLVPLLRTTTFFVLPLVKPWSLSSPIAVASYSLSLSTSSTLSPDRGPMLSLLCSGFVWGCPQNKSALYVCSTLSLLSYRGSFMAVSCGVSKLPSAFFSFYFFESHVVSVHHLFITTFR